MLNWSDAPPYALIRVPSQPQKDSDRPRFSSVSSGLAVVPYFKRERLLSVSVFFQFAADLELVVNPDGENGTGCC